KGVAIACVNLATLHKDGNGVTRDLARAAALFRSSCERGAAEGCNELGALYEGARDYPQAASLYETSCNGGLASACNNLGEMFQVLRDDFEHAALFYGRACQGGSVRGCSNLGWVYESGQGGLTKDLGRAIAFYKRGCDHDDGYGCAA